MHMYERLRDLPKIQKAVTTQKVCRVRLKRKHRTIGHHTAHFRYRLEVVTHVISIPKAS